MTDYEVKNRRAFEFTRKASNAVVSMIQGLRRAWTDVKEAIDRTWRGRG